MAISALQLRNEQIQVQASAFFIISGKKL